MRELVCLCFFFLLLLKKASLQMSELFNLGTEARTVVLRAHGAQTATEKTSYLFFMLFFFMKKIN